LHPGPDSVSGCPGVAGAELGHGWMGADEACPMSQAAAQIDGADGLGVTEIAGVMTPARTHFGTFPHIRSEQPKTHEKPMKPPFFRGFHQIAYTIATVWFLQHIEVSLGDPDKVTKSLILWTYDPKLEKFVAWAFQSNGNVVSSTGKWDSTSKAFALATVEPPSKMREQFLDAQTIKGNLTFIDNGGMNMVWTRNRQAESEGKATRQQWSKVGTPIQPLPFELKKLQPLIGEWDSEIGPTGPLLERSDDRSKGQMTVQWILDGRYLLISTENGKGRFFWIIGYDPAKGKYRRITFTNSGQSPVSDAWQSKSAVGGVHSVLLAFRPK